MNDLYPLLFAPVFKDYVWGGRNLAHFGKTLPAGRVAESWEIAAHEDGDTVVINGRYTGYTLRQLHAELGLALIGTNCAWAQERGKFPLLIKLLDAQENLSVQVHPDDAYAQAHEGNELGKTEMWVVLEAKPGAAVILGVKDGTTPARFEEAIAAGQLEPYLHHIPVQKGSVICVPSGSVHAILGGLVIAEIQQNSNTTYRVYDWNRGQGDQKRPLHIPQAMAVINFEQIEPTACAPVGHLDNAGNKIERLCANRYFTTERIEMAAGTVYDGVCDGRSLEIWGVLSGSVMINSEIVTAVRFALLPAATGAFRVAAQEPSVLLRTAVQ